MTRMLAIAYAIATVAAVSTVPGPAPHYTDTLANAQGDNPVAALHAAWEQAETDVAERCQELGMTGGEIEVGTEQVAPIDGVFHAEVFAQGVCR